MDYTRLLFAGCSIREDASRRATSSSSHFKRRRHQSLLEKNLCNRKRRGQDTRHPAPDRTSSAPRGIWRPPHARCALPLPARGSLRVPGAGGEGAPRRSWGRRAGGRGRARSSPWRWRRRSRRWARWASSRCTCASCCPCCCR